MEEQEIISTYARFLIDYNNSRTIDINAIDLILNDINSIRDQLASPKVASHIVDFNGVLYTKEDLFNEIKNSINQNSSSSQIISEEEKQNIINSIKDVLSQNLSSGVANAIDDGFGKQYTYMLLIEEIKALIAENKTNTLISFENNEEYSVDMILNKYKEVVDSQNIIISSLKEEIITLKNLIVKQNEKIDNIINNDVNNAKSLTKLNDKIKTFKPFKKI